jgi:hypothetical protein
MKPEFQQDPRKPNKKSIPTGGGSYRDPPTPKYVTQRQKPAGLGTIGGKKPIGNSRTKSVSSTASDVSETPGTSKAPRMSQETESDEELSPQRLNPTRKLHESEETSGRTHSRGLGVIGGSRKDKYQNKSSSFLPPAFSVPTSPKRGECMSTEDESQSMSLLRSEQTKPGKHISKLGGIGGNKSNQPTCAPGIAKISIDPGNEEADATTATAATASVKGKLTTPLSSPPPPEIAQPRFQPEPDRELTTREKADRRRAELKRQLEAKSKAPMKKKRRF